MPTVDPEFEALCPALTDAEFEQLKANIEAEGLREPIITWGDVVVDGHNRLRACTELGVEVRTADRDFSDRDEAKSWMIRNQLGRRNLSPDAARLLRGKLYQLAKKPVGSNQHGRVPQTEVPSHAETSEKVAAATGVSRATVQRDAAFAAATDVVEAAVPGFTRKVTSGEFTRGDVAKIAEAVQSEPERAPEIIEETKAERERRKAEAVEKRRNRIPKPHAAPTPEAAEPESEPVHDEPRGTLASAWSEATPGERRAFLDSVGAVLFDDIDDRIRERDADESFRLMRKLSAPDASSTPTRWLIAAAADAGDVTLAQLGITWAATLSDAKSAYRRVAMRLHPDHGGNPQAFYRLNERWQKLIPYFEAKVTP